MMRQRRDPQFDATPDEPLAVPMASRQGPDVLALVIAWSRTEPDRMGECALLTPGRPNIIGRGGPRPEDDGRRADFGRARPGGFEVGPPLAAPNLSRSHLRIEPRADGLWIQRRGKGSVLLDGAPCDEGPLTPGSTLVLANELVLLCERRPAEIPGPALSPATTLLTGGTDALGLTGESPATWRLRDQLRFAAGSGSPVLVVGPSGAGKDVVARALHQASTHRDRPFVVLGGATLDREDLDALSSRTDSPFVVIDELSDVAPEVQPLLTRYISSKANAPPPRPRIVATNSGPLTVATTSERHDRGAGPPETLRADLGSRFIHTVRVPGLDERRADIPLIGTAILVELAETQPEIRQRFFENGRPRLSPMLVDRLLRHRWHAHLRELTALLWTAMTTAREAWLDATEDVLAMLAAPPEPARVDLTSLDKKTVEAALAAANGKIATAARALGLKNRWVLYRLMEKLDIG